MTKVTGTIRNTGVYDGMSTYAWAVRQDGVVVAAGAEGTRTDATRVVRSTKRSFQDRPLDLSHHVARAR